MPPIMRPCKHCNDGELKIKETHPFMMYGVRCIKRTMTCNRCKTTDYSYEFADGDLEEIVVKLLGKRM